MGRRGGRPSLNFSRFLAGKCVHVAPKKGPPFPDTRARNAEREDWATGIFLRAVGRQGIHLAGYTAQTREQEQDDREAGHVLIPSSNIIWNYWNALYPLRQKSSTRTSRSTSTNGQPLSQQALARACCEMGFPQENEAVKEVSPTGLVFYRETVRDQQPRPEGLGQKKK